MWLQLLTTTGAVGLILLLSAFAMLGLGMVRGVMYTTESANTSALLLLLTVWFLGWGCLNESLFGPMQPESVVYAVAFGLAAGAGSTAAPSNRRAAAVGVCVPGGAGPPDREVR